MNAGPCIRDQWKPLHRNDDLGFAQFLPSNQQIGASALALKHAANGLEQLLHMKFPRFLSHFLFNESLEEFLDTFLLYRERYYVRSKPSDLDEHLQQLDRFVVLVFVRVVSDEFQCLAAEDNKAQEEQVQSEYSALLRGSKLLTLPRILDSCTLCGENNVQLVGNFLKAVIALQPAIAEDFENVATELHTTAEQMREALTNNATTEASVPLDMLQYSVDIACSMCVLLEALGVSMDRVGLIGSSKCISSSGMALLQALGILFEEVVPLCQWALTRFNHQQHIADMGVFAQMRFLRAACAVVKAAHDSTATTAADVHTEQPTVPWAALVFAVMEVSLSGAETSSPDFLKPGSFSGDLYAICRNELEELIQSTEPDSTSADYSLSALREQPRFLTAPRPATSNNATAVATAAAASKGASEAPAPAPIAPVEAVKMILPELGEGFIQACLAVFNHNPDEVVAHVLEDNLPPKLAAMDRKAGQIWVGKRDSDEKDKAFIAKQRERMRAMERQEEMNQHLMHTFEREYDDDYDDQYDDVVGVSVGGGALAMDQDLTRKYNALVRSEESEMKYWDNIKVSNKRADGDSSDEDADAAADQTAEEGGESKQQPRGSKGPGAQGAEKVELSKLQRRRKEVRGAHHRRDRAAKKFSKGMG